MNVPRQSSTVQTIVVKLWNEAIWKNTLKLNVHNRSSTAPTKVKVYSKMAVTQGFEDMSSSNTDWAVFIEELCVLTISVHQ